MTSDIPGYCRSSPFIDDPRRLRLRKNYDFVLILPFGCPLEQTGEFLHTFFEFMGGYNSAASFLMVWGRHNAGDESVSPLAAFWNYFKRKMNYRNIADLELLELEMPSSADAVQSECIRRIFTLLKPVSFRHAFWFTPSPSSLPSAFRLNLLLESARLNRSDLNLAAYVIPFYKGILINGWMMPLAYLFGRRIRNPATPDFVFSREMMLYWLTREWPRIQDLWNCYLFMTLSAIPSGLKISEFFLGDKNFESLDRHPDSAEMIRTGLELARRYLRFVQNSTLLIASHSPVPSSIPFSMYPAEDLRAFLKSYGENDAFFRSRIASRRRRSGEASEIDRAARELLGALESRPDGISFTRAWNRILIERIPQYVHADTARARERIFKLFRELFSRLPGIWSRELSRMIRETRRQARIDAKRGFPWIGGKAGQYWHIHDQFEKQLQSDCALLHDLKGCLR